MKDFVFDYRSWTSGCAVSRRGFIVSPGRSYLFEDEPTHYRAGSAFPRCPSRDPGACRLSRSSTHSGHANIARAIEPRWRGNPTRKAVIVAGRARSVGRASATRMTFRQLDRDSDAIPAA